MEDFEELNKRFKDLQKRLPYTPKSSIKTCPKCGLTLETIMGYYCIQPLCPVGLGPIGT